MKPLSFIGKIPASKSMLNRLLIAKSYAGQAVRIEGDSSCEDVTLMREALRRLNSIGALDAGSAGAVLRFLALRVSRIKGRHRIEGSARLFSRPQDELLRILKQLGVQAEIESNALQIESEGWRLQGDTLLVSAARSSQFASGILLNAWNLPFDLYVSMSGGVSEGYWRMTVRQLETLGMKIDFWDTDFRVPKMQMPKAGEYRAESDMSSAFAVAAVAAVNGQATFLDFPKNSVQPDAGFVEILQTMGAKVAWSNETSLKIEKSGGLKGVAVNLRSMPDLFPVLAMLCALAEGESDLYGAPQLKHKESDRLTRMAEIVQQLGRKVQVREDGLKISGPLSKSERELEISTDQDHRLAFALAVAQAAGWPIRILHPEVVSKSFPEFWNIVGWRP